jgi:UDP-glucose 4-epimerase
MAHVWITGAHGFIGRHLARWLTNQSHTVAGIGHGAWPQVEAARWGVSSWINGEVSASNLGQMRRVSSVPDYVFHLAGGSSVGAAFASPQEDFTRTVASTAELLEWLRQQAPAVRVTAVSSAAVYGAGHEGAIAENARLTPFSPYGAHKLMMEDLCRSYAANFGLQLVLPRLFSVYGAELKKQLLWDLCGKFAAGGAVDLGGTGNELRDWTDVRDVVRVLDQAARLASDQAPVLNLATGRATPVREIASTVALHWGGVEAAARVSFSGRSRPGDPFSLVANIDRMRSQGIECPIPVTQGVAEYVDWFRARPMDAN